jgi:hypothetical protein
MTATFPLTRLATVTICVFRSDGDYSYSAQGLFNALDPVYRSRSPSQELLATFSTSW